MTTDDEESHLTGQDEAPRAVSGTRRAMRELADGTIRVQIDIDPTFTEAFRLLFPTINAPVALAPLANEAARHELMRHTIRGAESDGSLAQRLHAKGYFRNPMLWRALHLSGLYTLAEHKAYIEGLPCALKNNRCQGQVVGHHCKASHIPLAGPKLQPDAPQKVPHWYLVPACDWHHRCVIHGTGPDAATRQVKEHLLTVSIGIMAEQAKEAMKVYLEIPSLSRINEALLRDFEEYLGIDLSKVWK